MNTFGAIQGGRGAFGRLGAALLCPWLVSCTADSFTMSGTGPETDASADSSAPQDGSLPSDSSSSKDSAPPPDSSVPVHDSASDEASTKDALEPEASIPDATSEPPACSAVEQLFAAEADGWILQESSNCEASISFTLGGCANLNFNNTSRVIVRFALSDDVVRAARQGQLILAQLQFELATDLVTCNSTGIAPNQSGSFDVYPMRSDWLEGDSYRGAQWCYRQGTGSQALGGWGPTENQWESPGAEGPSDRGNKMAVFTLDATQTAVTVPLAADLVQAWIQGNSLSLQLAPAQASLVLAYIKTHESNHGPVLRLSWCR